jgi:hypothetical protein
LEILVTSHCTLNSAHGVDVVEKHFILEQQQTARAAAKAYAWFFELVCLHLGLRRHRNRPPPSFNIKPAKPRPVIHCVALSRKLPSLLLTNANHLTNKIDLLNGLLDDSNVNIAFITETWFDKNNSAVMKRRLNANYHALSATRDDREAEKSGGGSLLQAGSLPRSQVKTLPRTLWRLTSRSPS